MSGGSTNDRKNVAQTRLTTLRAPGNRTGDANSGGNRRPRVCFSSTKLAAPRRTAPPVVKTENESVTSRQSTERRPPRVGLLPSLSHRVRGRGDIGDKGRGGRTSNRGRGNLPTGKVAFVGTLAGGSSFDSGGSSAPSQRAAVAAADGFGISVLDDRIESERAADEQEPTQIQWPPVVKSPLEPMILPFGRGPEPQNVGELFSHSSEDTQPLMDDSIIFFQLPTTLPLAKAKRVANVKKEVVESEEKMDEAGNPFKIESSSSAAKADKKKEPMEKRTEPQTDESLPFDQSLHRAPGGYIGKLCIRKSGRTVLMLDDKAFDVSMAQTPTFCEDVYSIDPESNQLFILGSVARHLIVTPDFDSLLA
ncbi:hypothetical protein ABG067_001046 [Albugo candida]